MQNLATREARRPSAANGAGGETEQVTLIGPNSLPGVELWTVCRSIRPWPAFHTTYVFCTPERLDNQPLWRCRGVTHRLGPTSTIVLEPGELHVATDIPAPADLHFLLVAAEVVQRARTSWAARSQPARFPRSPRSTPPPGRGPSDACARRWRTPRPTRWSSGTTSPATCGR